MKRMIAFLTLSLASLAAFAGDSNDVPSCYKANAMGSSPAPQREVFVLVDQTVMLDPTLRRTAETNLNGLIGPGTKFSIAEFSSFEQGRYLKMDNVGILEQTVPAGSRDSISERKLASFDRCMADQATYGKRLAYASLSKALGNASDSLGKSDIMASLKDLSSLIKASHAKKKVVFLISDMLENSSVSSFYSRRGVRRISAERELAKAEKAGMIGDFGGAEIYVEGAGLISEAGSKKGVYRDPQTMRELESFWNGYFKKSNATVREFGAPDLISPISWN